MYEYLDLLKDRLLNYSSEKATEFYNSLPVSNHESMEPEYPLSTWGFPNNYLGYNLWVIAVHNKGTPPYTVWENFDNGVLFYNDRTVVFLENSGFIFKLTKTYFQNEWMMNQELYKLNQDKKLIRMEEPLIGQIFTFNNSDYLYSKVFRENYKSSINIHQIHCLKRINKIFLIEIVNECTKLLTLMKTIYDRYNYGCPNLGTSLSKFSVDDSKTFGGVWTDFKHWNLTFEEFLTVSYTGLLHYLDDHKLDDIVSDDDARDVLTYAVNEWKKFGVDEWIFRKIEIPNHNLIVCTSYAKNIRTFDKK